MQENRNIIIREADPGDIEDICRLLALLFEQEVEFEPDYEMQKRGVSEIVSDPHKGLFLVIEESGCITGCVSLLFLVSTALGGKTAILEDMIIEPGARCRGLGSRLLDKAIDCAREKGCLRITVLTDKNNESAQKLYEKSSFKKSPMIPMRLIL
ncbi:MAG TPA: GNAT family N-acetyltransferase [Desulfomonilia bacterium]